MTFYNMMVLEGFIAMVWAAAAMGIFNLGMQAANSSATATVITVSSVKPERLEKSKKSLRFRL